MSNVHIRTIEDASGDLVDLAYFHHGCAPADVPGWPAPEAIDYPVDCAACGERVEEVPLTEAGEAYAAELARQLTPEQGRRISEAHALASMIAARCESDPTTDAEWRPIIRAAERIARLGRSACIAEHNERILRGEQPR